MRDNVVITGIGCISSLGIGGATFAERLLAGDSGIAPIARFSTEGCRAHTAAILGDFEPARFIDPMKLRRIDEVGRLAIATCRLAIDDAGLPPGTDGVGIVLGTTTAGLHSAVTHVERLMADGPAAVPAMGFSNTIGNAAASLCSIEFGFKGPNVTIGQKQASALAALAFAVDGLWQGRAEAFVCGGADDIEEQFFRIHDRLGVISPGRGDEEGSRPFDARRNGFVLGTGGHLLVAETAAAAAKRGASVYGEILGLGMSSSDCPLNAWPQEPSGIVRTMRAALADAAVAAEEVTAVFASANSTPALDRIEACAIREVFGSRAVPVVSIKGAVGEFGAVGAASVSAALLCLRRGMLPPTTGLGDTAPDCPVNAVGTARPADGALALVNATADGGAHFSVLVRAAAGG
jgi:3-oxoacyl-[acyl-carrier-protein] synthase II